MAKANDVADLLLRIDATTEGLRRELKRAEKGVNQSGGKMQSVLKKVDAGFKQFRQTATKVAKVAATAFAGLATAIAGMTAAGLKSVDALAKVSSRLGIATGELAKLRFAAEQTGVASNTLDMALQRMTRRVAEAAQGTGEAVGALDELGISAQELVKLSPDQMFRRVTEAMEGVGNQSDKVRLAMKLFDSEGVSLVQTMAAGADGLDEFGRQAELAGIAINDIDASKVEAANDAINKAKTIFTGFTQQLAVRMAPVLEAIAERLFRVGTESEGAAGAATRSFSAMVTSAGKVADVAHGIGTTFEMAGKVGALAFLGLERASLQLQSALINGPIQALNLLIEGFNSVPMLPQIDPIELSQWGQGIENRIELINGAMTAAVDDIHDTLMEPLPSVAIEQFVKDVERKFNRMTSVVTLNTRRLDGSIGDVALAMQRFSEETGEADEAVNKIIDSLENEITALGMTSREQAIFNAELKALSAGAGPEAIATIRQLAGESFDLQQAQKEAGQAAEDAARKAQENWQRTHEYLTNAFIDIANNGGNAFDNIAKSFSAMIQRMIAEWAASGLMDMFGMGSGSSASNAVSSMFGGNGSGGGGGAFDAIGNIFGGGSGGSGVDNVFQSTKGGVDPRTLGQAANDGGGFSFDSGAAMDFAKTAGAAIVGSEIGKGLGEGVTNKTSNSNLGAQSGTVIGSVLGGPIGAGIGATIGSFADTVFGSGTPSANLGMLVGPAPGVPEDRKFDIPAFASGFQATGFLRRGDMSEAAKIVEAFAAVDAATVDSIRRAGGNVSMSGATLNGFSETGTGSGVALGIASEGDQINSPPMNQQLAKYASDVLRHATGLSEEQKKNILNGVDGSHRNGLHSVPYDGYRAELHAGERVLTSSEAGSRDADMKGMKSEISQLRNITSQLLTQLVLSSKDQAEILERFEFIGLPQTRTA